MTLEEAQKFIGKEVTYQNQTSILTDVRQLNSGMIIGFTDKDWRVNIEILKYKDENGVLKSIVS